MTNTQPTPKQLATALGALAIALSAPAFAQDIPAQTAPPPAVAAQPAQPAAPAPAPAVDPTPAPLAIAPTAAPEAPAADTPVAQPTTTPSFSRARVTRTAAAPTRSPAQRAETKAAETKAVDPTPAPLPQVAAEPKPVPTPVAAAVVDTPAAKPAPLMTENESRTQSASDTGTDWPLVGGLATGIIGAGLLGFIGIAGSTRRRRPDRATPRMTDPAHTGDARVVIPNTATAPEAMADRVVAPAARPAVTPAVMPAIPAAAPAPALDGSKIGRFEAAAIQGPTADNPFLTRRARVRRARFFDRRERLAAEAMGTAVPAAPRPVAAPIAASAAPRAEQQITYVFGKQPPRWNPTPAIKKS